MESIQLFFEEKIDCPFFTYTSNCVSVYTSNSVDHWMVEYNSNDEKANMRNDSNLNRVDQTCVNAYIQFIEYKCSHAHAFTRVQVKKVIEKSSNNCIHNTHIWTCT